MPQIRLTSVARRDLIDLWLEIAADNPSAADRVYDRIAARIEILNQFAKAGPLRPEIAPDARSLVEPPYLILYRVNSKGIEIVRVLHGARSIDETLFIAGVES